MKLRSFLSVVLHWATAGAVAVAFEVSTLRWGALVIAYACVAANLFTSKLGKEFDSATRRRFALWDLTWPVTILWCLFEGYRLAYRRGALSWRTNPAKEFELETERLKALRRRFFP